jgi:OOP family OmpA-OmpF porin
LIGIIVHFLNENPMIKVNIIFHSDEIGGDAANQALSQRFAEQFRKYLIHHGIKMNRIIPIGMGESKPLTTSEEIEKLKTEEEKDEANAKNRRVEIQIAEF